MCSSEGRRRLAALFLQIAAAAQNKPSQRTRLVLAGDVVDFLAIEDDRGRWSAFTADEDVAARMLTKICKGTKEIWSALSAAVAKGVHLTLLLGNHDIELTLPRVRRALLQRIGPGSVDFVYDNEAFRLGPLLVEHGNRYDGWNVVAHDSLRRVRSRLSRGEPKVEFPTQPGSELVARVMNKIKAKYGFVDLLKPETRGMLPILAALDGEVWSGAWPAIYQLARSAWRRMQYDNDGRPTENEFVAERAEDSPAVYDATREKADAHALARAREGEVPKDDFPDAEHFEEALRTAKESADSTTKVAQFGSVKTNLLLSALRWWAKRDKITWDVAAEAEEYIRAATTLAGQGPRVIVFGHTHLAKRVALGDGAVYLNTGTWADLVRLPAAVVHDDHELAKQALEQLLEKLKANDLAALRRPVPTYAKIRLEDETRNDSAVDGDVLFFDSDGKSEPISTEGFLVRLLGEVPA